MRDDDGSTTVLASLVGLALTGAVVAAMVPLLGDLVDRQRAQSAADAAALAGVTGGRTAAASVTRANEATLVVWRRDGREVLVEVRVGGQTAVARATDGP